MSRGPARVLTPFLALLYEAPKEGPGPTLSSYRRRSRRRSTIASRMDMIARKNRRSSASITLDPRVPPIMIATSSRSLSLYVAPTRRVFYHNNRGESHSPVSRIVHRRCPVDDVGRLVARGLIGTDRARRARDGKREERRDREGRDTQSVAGRCARSGGRGSRGGRA